MNKPLMTFVIALALSVPLAVQAAPEQDFKTVYQKAAKSHQDAGTFQWTVTSDRLKSAKSAADSGDYEKATAIAREALKLAEESAAQRREQQEAWRNAAIGN